jgi:transcriptional regulator with XRE-family HTH domain
VTSNLGRNFNSSDLAVNLSRFLVERQISQGELASRARLSQPYISKLLNVQVNRPSFETVRKIAHALSVTTEELTAEQSLSHKASLSKNSRQLRAFISSAALDLPEHRGTVIDACLRAGVMPVALERIAANNADQPIASLDVVRNVDLFILLLGHRYGIAPRGYQASLAELEYKQAVKLGLPVLVFSMSSDHPVTTEMIEYDAAARQKLISLKARASTGRIRGEFRSAEDLRDLVLHALSEVQRAPQTDSPISHSTNPIPKAPALYAEPDFIGAHEFVGRDAELQSLSDWALPADPTNLLLFEAIGGNGKSMLAWQWTQYHSTAVRTEWAGRFWYSFYEKGASMADFCQRALTYMTAQPLEELRKKKTTDLKELLLAQLHARPWLLILDGLERVLVAYHHPGEAEVHDENINTPTDKIVNRNPLDVIRDEDSDLLRALAAASPSKILITSRLTPRVLLNPSGQPILGAKRITLPGLRPLDAEKLFRSCNVAGDSSSIQRYLTANCANHPLVIGVLSSLINNYLPARGDFDAWVADPDGGAKLDLTSLDLIQRRNHILHSALDALSPASYQLLSTLALLSEAVDYETLNALNPHLPPEPEEVNKPKPPEKSGSWNNLLDEEKLARRKQDEFALAHRKDHDKAAGDQLAVEEVREASKKLASTVRDLEQRGLLQYDARTQRYNLHPVVRGVAAGMRDTRAAIGKLRVEKEAEKQDEGMAGS